MTHKLTIAAIPVRLAAAALAFAFLSTTAIIADEVLTNGNFETGDFTGWTVGITPDYASGGRPYNIDSTGDGWIVSNTTNWLNPIAGYSAFNGFDGGTTAGNEADLDFYLRQQFSFEGTVIAAPLSFKYDINGGPYASYSSRGTPVEARVFDVRILSNSLSPLATVYTKVVPVQVSHADGDIVLTTVNQDLTVALNSLGAGDYWLEFHELIPQYYTGGGAFVLDNISLDITAVPEPSTLALSGIALIGLATYGWRQRKRTVA